MTSPTNINSIRSSLVLMIPGFTLLVVFLSIALIANIFINDNKNQIQQNVKQLAYIIGSQSLFDIKSNNYDHLNQSLASIKHIANINYVHIYRINPNSSEIDFFTSYNRNKNYPAIIDKISEIEKLSTVKFSDNIIEYIAPIAEEDQILGYIYIQSNLDNLNEQIRKLMLSLLIFFIIATIFSLMIVTKLQHIVSAPIKSLIKTIQHVAQRKEYSKRCDPPSYKEFLSLTKNIDILFERTEKLINKQTSSEQQVVNFNTELKDKLSNRTDALKESNQELLSTLEKLHQFQGQLVESEKMASLGDMVAGVAHEVNTPIGLGVTASTLLSDRLLEIKKAFEDKSLKSSQLKKFLDEGQENVGIIYRNLSRAADLISSFKKVAVDQSNEEARKFNVSELLNEVLLTLAPQIKNLPYQIELHCPNELMVTTKPGPINQILINLILNSIIHGFEGKDEGKITITVMHLSEQLNISYQDNGLGIAKDMKTKVFEPFTTTKRGSGGSGLGLHLVYNLVTQALGGTIQLESEPGKGVNFEINFPIG